MYIALYQLQCFTGRSRVSSPNAPFIAPLYLWLSSIVSSSQYSSSNNNSSPITNERLIRDAEAECDKINCFYRGPCNKDIYDRATLDKYLVDTAVGEFLEHDCFSFDKSVLLNRQVDKTKLKGLVLDDISEGRVHRTANHRTAR